jgi:hypothetical protein
LGCEVDYPLELLLFEEVCHSFPVFQIHSDMGVVGVVGVAGEACLFECGVVVVVMVI